METRCQKCGAGIAPDQAFCPRCGAVVGMSAAAASRRDEDDMASTMMGRQSPPTAARRPTAERAAQAVESDVPHLRRGPLGNTVRLAVIGFVAVLLIGGLLVLLLYLNSRR